MIVVVLGSVSELLVHSDDCGSTWNCIRAISAL